MSSLVVHWLHWLSHILVFDGPNSGWRQLQLIMPAASNVRLHIAAGGGVRGTAVGPPAPGFGLTSQAPSRTRTQGRKLSGRGAGYVTS